MRLIQTFLIVILLLFSSSQVFAQTLQRLRDEVRVPEASGSASVSPSPATSGRPKDRHCDDGSAFRSNFSDDDDDDHYGFGNLIAGAFLVGVSSPYWLPRRIAQDIDYRPGYFLEHPYADHSSNLDEIPVSESVIGGSLFRLRLEGGTDFDHLSVAGGQILVDMPWRLGVDSEFAYRQEEWELMSDPFSDDLWTGDINLVFRFAQSPRMQMRIGAGVNYLFDDVNDDWGFNFTYGGDFFPKDPFIVSLETDLGHLGDSGLLHVRATAGVAVRNAEFFSGFDFYRVGNVKVPSMVAGVRFWF